MAELSYTVKNYKWLKNMTLSARLPKMTVKLAWHIRFRLKLGLLIIHMGCKVMGIGFNFEEDNYVTLE